MAVTTSMFLPPAGSSLLSTALLLLLLARDAIARPGFFGNAIRGAATDDEDELGVMDVLASFGEKLFSLPDNNTGEAVSR